jgi:hypothetical protein
VLHPPTACTSHSQQVQLQQHLRLYHSQQQPAGSAAGHTQSVQQQAGNQHDEADTAASGGAEANVPGEDTGAIVSLDTGPTDAQRETFENELRYGRCLAGVRHHDSLHVVTSHSCAWSVSTQSNYTRCSAGGMLAWRSIR